MLNFPYNLHLRSSFCLVLLLFSFSEKVYGQAPVANFTTNIQSACAPLSVNFTNTSTNAVSYQWNFGNGNFSTLANPQNVYIQPGTFTVQLIAIGANGLSDTLIRTDYITAAPGPQLSISVSQIDGCEDFTGFQFTCTTTDALNLNWDFGDGSTSSLQNPTKFYTNVGNYTVSLLGTNSNGCPTAVTLADTLSVVALPVAGFTVDDIETCNPLQSFQFTSTTSTNYTYLWDFGDGTTSNLINPSHVFAYPDTFSIQLKITNSLGCADSLIISNLVTVHPDNTPQINASVLSGCLPLASSLTSSNITGAVSYNWTSSDGQSSVSPGFSVTYFPAGSYNINLTVEMPNGCIFTNPQPTVIQVNPKPISSFTATNTNGCAPLNVQLTNTSTGATNYLWTFGDGNVSLEATPQYSYTQPGTYTITLKSFNEFGCWRTSTFSPIVVTAPTITANMSNSVGCPPLNVSFTNTTINAISYLWDFGDGTTSTELAPQHIYDTLGQYQVTLVAYGSGGCTDTLVFPTMVNVSAQLANYTIPPPIAGCEPFTTTFGLNDPNISSFLWDFGDGTTSTEANPSHTYTNTGAYTVSLEINDGTVCNLAYPAYQQITVEGITPAFDVAIDPCPPYAVHFTDTVSDAVSWLWEFGDGTTSTLQNPTHIYPNTNNYHVGLTITTSAGCTRTYAVFNAVTFTNYQPSFTTTYSPNLVYPLTVNFTGNPASATSWLWNFGDGTSSTLQNPSHVYQVPGNYVATLTTVSNGCTFTVSGNPINPANNGNGGTVDPITTLPSIPFVSCAPATIAFFKQSPNHQVIQWNFGDGTTSTASNPIKIYTTPGFYNVSYQAITPSGLQTIIYPQSLHIGGYTPDIILTTSNDCDSFYIATNLSNAALFDQVQWKFGNSPFYNGVQVNYQTTFSNLAVNIRAFVTDTLGCNAIGNNNILMNKPMPFVSYPTTVCRDSIHFIQLGNTTGLSFVWDFDDGTSSSETSPVHQYDSTGAYNVVMTINTAQGCSDTYTLSPQIIFATPNLQNVIVNGEWDGCAPHAIEIIYPTPLAFVNYIQDGVFITNSDTLQISYPDTGSYPALIMVATATWIAGCRDTVEFPTIHVYDAFADFSFTQDSYCLPITAQFTDESPEAVSWSWNFGNGITSTEQNPQIVFNEEPEDTVQLIITTAFGCTDTIVKSGVFMYQFQQQIAFQGVCNPLTVNFDASSNMPTQYEWHLGNGQVITDSTFLHTYTEDGFYSPYLVGISNTGCRDTTFLDTTIRVSSIQADFNSPFEAACAPSFVEFFSTGTGAVAWEWDFDDNSGSILEHPIKLYDSPGVYSISLSVTSVDGCRDTLVKNDYITVLGPATSFTVSAPSGCAGRQLQFTDLSTGAQEWEWNFGEGSTSAEQFPTFTYENSGNYIVTLFSRDSIGCSAFYSIPIPFTVNPSPQAIFSVLDSSGCTPFSPIFANQSLDAINNYWNLGDGSVVQLDTIPSYTYSQAGLYTIELIVENQYACFDTMYVDSIQALLVPQAALSLEPLNTCAPIEVQGYNESTDLENPTYLLNFSNGLTGTNPDSVYEFMQQGFYGLEFQVHNANGCSDTITYNNSFEVLPSDPPPAMKILRVSVEGPSSVVIEWNENFNPNFSHYNLIRRTSGLIDYSLVATITDPHQLVYYDSQVNTFDSVYCYLLETVDFCERKLPVDSLIAHCTINLEVENFANQGNDLKWTPYVGRTPSGYVVVRTNESTNVSEGIATVSGDSTHYLDNDVFCPVKYKYEILAIELDGLSHLESSSDYDLAPPIENPFVNQFVNVGRSTVVDNSKILTEWAAPDLYLDKVVGYTIYKEDGNNKFKIVAEVPVSQQFYMDEDVDVNNKKYKYQVFTRNVCDVESGKGVEGDNIVLRIKPYDEQLNELIWTPYESWGPNGVNFYIIEKQKEDGTWEFVISVPGFVNSYLDENY